MAQLNDCQKDPVGNNSLVIAPHEYYNKHWRKEGEPVLDKKQYEEMVIKQREIKSSQSSLYEMYPLTPEDATTNTR